MAVGFSILFCAGTTPANESYLSDLMLPVVDPAAGIHITKCPVLVEGDKSLETLLKRPVHLFTSSEELKREDINILNRCNINVIFKRINTPDAELVTEIIFDVSKSNEFIVSVSAAIEAAIACLYANTQPLAGSEFQIQNIPISIVPKDHPSAVAFSQRTLWPMNKKSSDGENK